VGTTDLKFHESFTEIGPFRESLPAAAGSHPSKSATDGAAGFVVELGVQTPAGVNVEERPFEGRVARRMRWPSGPVYRIGIVRPVLQGLKPCSLEMPLSRP
jgi:hypothetical protein